MLSAIRTSLSRLSSLTKTGSTGRKKSQFVGQFVVAFDDVVAQTVEEQNQSSSEFRGGRSGLSSVMGIRDFKRIIKSDIFWMSRLLTYEQRTH